MPRHIPQLKPFVLEMLFKPSCAPGLFKWCLYAAIDNDTQSVNNITIIAIIIGKSFDGNIF